MNVRNLPSPRNHAGVVRGSSKGEQVKSSLTLCFKSLMVLRNPSARLAQPGNVLAASLAFFASRFLPAPPSTPLCEECTALSGRWNGPRSWPNLSG